MKYWMLALPVAVLAFSNPAQAEVKNDPKLLSDQLFRTGLTYCNAASKKSRTDTVGARENFKEYLSHLERAKTIYPEIFRENAFVSREAKRCELVQDNIARAEAMPIVEESLAFCSEAKTALKGTPDIAGAQANLAQYHELKDKALATTPTVLRVGSVAVQMRVCDRLEEKISLAQNQRNQAEKLSEQVIAFYNKAADTCSVGTDMLKAGVSNSQQLQAAEKLLNRLSAYQVQANDEAEALMKNRSLAASTRQDLNRMQSEITQCQTQVVAKVGQARKAIQARVAAAKAAEAERIAQQKAEQAKQAELEAQLVAAEQGSEPVEAEAAPLLQGGEVAQLGTSDL